MLLLTSREIGRPCCENLRDAPHITVPMQRIEIFDAEDAPFKFPVHFALVRQMDPPLPVPGFRRFLRAGEFTNLVGPKAFADVLNLPFKARLAG